ncbi:MAG: S-layer homology domain-containing protein [Oscillospiraceae bacterium]|nr:S-layer homology domain-containing protein [Oscillospiraceae bacterium]
MKKTLTKRLLAVAMMASMVLSMALPVSAASYTLKLEIKEGIESVKESLNGGKSQETVKVTSGTVNDATDLTDALTELLIANFGDSAEHETYKAEKKGLWVFESDAMALLIEAGIKAKKEGNWNTWLAGFESDENLAGDASDLLALLKTDATVGEMGVGSYSMTYEPDVADDADPAKGNTYTFTLVCTRKVVGGGSTPSTPVDPTPVDPTPVDPTPSTDVVVDVPVAAEPDAVVTLPVEKVETGKTITVNTKSETPVKVEVPVAETNPGIVVVIVKADGTEQIVRDSVVTDKGVQTTVSNGDKIMVKDNSKTFNDVTDAHWGKNAVTFVASRELFAGYSDGSFAPDQATNRGMIVQVLHNLEYNVAHHLDGHAFPDVLDHHWYDDAVHWAEDNGVASGYGDGTFKGEKNVTREELVVMLWNYAGKQVAKDATLVNGFGDAAKVSDWALAAMNWALENGIMGGKGGKMLDPTGLSTRAELAQMIKNFCEYK